MKRFFSPELISRIRVAEVNSRQIPEPLFYAKAKTMGIRNLPVLAHMASLTFVDVLVFTGPMTERDLFHALVHAAQFEVLGLVNWADLYVRGFLKQGRDFLVPYRGPRFRARHSIRHKPRARVRRQIGNIELGKGGTLRRGSSYRSVNEMKISEVSQFA